MNYFKNFFLLNAVSFFSISVACSAHDLNLTDPQAHRLNPSIKNQMNEAQFVEKMKGLTSVTPVVMRDLLTQVHGQPELFQVFLQVIPQKVYPQYDPEAALVMINFAARDNRLGFTNDSRTATSGFEFLRRQVLLGSEEAQGELNEAAVNGCLIFNTPAKSFEYLKKIAARKNPQGGLGIGAEDAQIRLNGGTLRGKLGFNHETGQKYLESVIERGTIGVDHARVLLTAFREALGSH